MEHDTGRETLTNVNSLLGSDLQPAPPEDIGKDLAKGEVVHDGIEVEDIDPTTYLGDDFVQGKDTGPAKGIDGDPAAEIRSAPPGNPYAVAANMNEVPDIFGLWVSAAEKNDVGGLSRQLRGLRDASEGRQRIPGLVSLLHQRLKGAEWALTKAELQEAWDDTRAPTAGGFGDDENDAAELESLEPWPTRVDGASVADEVHRLLMDRVVFANDADPVAATLWVLGTYLMDEWYLWPKVVIHSPTHQCGKTTLMVVLEAVCYRSLLTVNASESVFFRAIDKWKPTVIFDEADRFLGERDEIAGLINAGHTRRTAVVMRAVDTGEGDWQPARFTVWSPQVLGGIGLRWVSRALQSRSIMVNLRRKLASESVTRLDARTFEQQVDMRRKLLRWAEDNRISIGAQDIDPPDCGDDRMRDNWGPLFRIAETLGGGWPERCLAAYHAKSTWDGDETELGLALLQDAHQIATHLQADIVKSGVLVAELNKMEEQPWGEMRNDKGVSTQFVAKRLKEFGVHPTLSRQGSVVIRGYAAADLEDAAARYSRSVEAS